MGNSTCILLCSVIVFLMAIFVYNTERNLINTRDMITVDTERQLANMKASLTLETERKLSETKALSERKLTEMKELSERKLSDMKDLITKMNERHDEEIKRLKEDVRPAFTATLTHSEFLSLAKGEILKFDKVYLDSGSGYDSKTGFYTTQKSGVYLVSCTVRPWGTNLHVWLWKDGERLVLAYGGGWNTGSLTVVLNLQKGNKLYIKHDDGSYVGNEVIQTGNTSMFSVTFLSDY